MSQSSFFRRQWFASAGIGLLALLNALPAAAHHAIGGRLPANAGEGFLSGLAHPVLGPDHLLFVLAAGGLASLYQRGWIIPVTFLVGMLPGVALHLSGLSLASNELLVAGSVVLFGLLLTFSRRLGLIETAALAGTAGLFHGYAYAESIVGAEMSPLWSYLLGLVLVQLAIALGTAQLSTRLLNDHWRRWLGFAIAGLGLSLLPGLL